jgi:hypothetical protein
VTEDGPKRHSPTLGIRNLLRIICLSAQIVVNRVTIIAKKTEHKRPRIAQFLHGFITKLPVLYLSAELNDQIGNGQWDGSSIPTTELSGLLPMLYHLG